MRRKRQGELLELVGMAKWANKKIKTYSKGMMQRVGLAQALINDPDLIVLDEPTDGVDPVGRREIREVLERLRDEGKTVFLNSHLLSELEMVCSRVAILVQGNVAQQGSIDDLTRDSSRYEIDISGRTPDWIAESDKRMLAGDVCRITVRETNPEFVQPVIDRLRQAGCIIVSIRPVRESLEDLFMRAVQDPDTGKARLPGAGDAR